MKIMSLDSKMGFKVQKTGKFDEIWTEKDNWKEFDENNEPCSMKINVLDYSWALIWFIRKRIFVCKTVLRQK